MDRVRPIKIESPAIGGTQEDNEYTPADENEDALEARGYYIQDDTTTDETTLIARTGSNMTFKDGNNPTEVTLTDLLESGGGSSETVFRRSFLLMGG